MKFFKLKHVALLLAIITIFSTGCGKNKKTNSNTGSPTGESTPQPSHTHVFNQQVRDESHLKESATCRHGDQYYYSCTCGENGEEFFDNYVTIPCDYSAEVEDQQYLRRKATCQRGAEYYKSCTMCGDKAYRDTFFSTKLGDHDYKEENPSGKFIKEEATTTSPAIYYKSCVCGVVGTETFSYGEPLRDYTDQEKKAYAPTSLTITLYDPINNVYGITYNTQKEPLRAVIQVSTNVDFSNAIEFPTYFEKLSATDTEGSATRDFFAIKAEIDLDKNTTYYYRAYDKYVDVGSEYTTLVTKDATANSFTFAHVSDTQSSGNTGDDFNKVLAHVTKSSDFIVHTGDVVEWSNRENEWTNMLHKNYSYLSTIPVMAISGNHETTYQAGNKETYKHFNHNIPVQTDTNKGYFYSFVYGNVKFIMLNTNRLTGTKLTDDQYEWLISELENNTATWTFVAMHNPMYSVGVYGSNPERNQICVGLREQLHNIFVEYGVDVVLQGHDHLISKTHTLGLNGDRIAQETREIDGTTYAVSNGGVIYVMSGTGGVQTRSVYLTNNALTYDIALDSQKRSWSEFTVDGNKLTVKIRYATSATDAVDYRSWNLIKDVA